MQYFQSNLWICQVSSETIDKWPLGNLRTVFTYSIVIFVNTDIGWSSWNLWGWLVLLNVYPHLSRVHTEGRCWRQHWHFWICPELTWILMLMLMLGVNDAIETNVFLSSVNATVNVDARCEQSLTPPTKINQIHFFLTVQFKILKPESLNPYGPLMK